MKRKFQEGDFVVFAKKYEDRYNPFDKPGVIGKITGVYDSYEGSRVLYEAEFNNGTRKSFYSYELDKITEEQKWEIESKLYKPDPNDMWKCPRCGSRKVHCHAGMFVDRFECQECHWDWR